MVSSSGLTPTPRRRFSSLELVERCTRHGCILLSYTHDEPRSNASVVLVLYAYGTHIYVYTYSDQPILLPILISCLYDVFCIYACVRARGDGYELGIGVQRSATWGTDCSTATKLQSMSRISWPSDERAKLGTSIVQVVVHVLYSAEHDSSVRGLRGGAN